MKRFCLHIAALSMLITGIAALTSCEDIHSPIFYYINQEVPLEDYGIVGDISGIVEHGSYLFVNSGHIYRKDKTPSATSGKQNKQWERAGSDPGTMYGLASDGTNLYSILVTYAEDSSTGNNSVISRQLYTSKDNGASWTAVSGATDVTALIQDRAEGKGYAKKSDGVYALSDGNVGTQLSGSVSTTVSVAKGKPINGVSASDGIYTFAASGTDLYYSDASKNPLSEGTKVSPNLGTIKSLEVTGDYLLVGTQRTTSNGSSQGGGIYRLKLTSGVPASSATAFDNNAQAIMSTSYVVTHLFALDQTKSESGTDIYAGVNISGAFSSSSHASFSSIGLYAYYPARGTWNRDGTADGSTTPKGN